MFVLVGNHAPIDSGMSCTFFEVEVEASPSIQSVVCVRVIAGGISFSSVIEAHMGLL